MTAMIWSVLAGGAGLLATWIAMTRLAQRQSEVQPVVSWVLGLAGLAPAWLIAFVGLLGASPLGRRPEQALPILAWLVSSAAALLGLFLSDAAFRRLRDSGRDHRPLAYWLVGLLAFLLAWAIALLGLAAKAISR